MELKSINDFFNDMLTAKAAQPALNFLDSTSKVSVWRLKLYLAAVGAWILQGLVKGHLDEINTIIENTKPSTVRWYRTKALSFQFGHALVYNDIVYDNAALSEDEIEAAKVVKHCATSGKLRGVRVKVAGENASGDLMPLPIEQAEALLNYLEQVKSPGVRIYLINQAADLLKLNLKIFYNPLVLTSDGKRLDGTNDTPVQQAIERFLKNLPFDGLFTIMQLVDALQAVEGVVIPHVLGAEASYSGVDYMTINVSYLPDAGYLKLEALTISYEPQNAL